MNRDERDFGTTLSEKGGTVAKKFSTIGSGDDPFAHERDMQFAELVKNPAFWNAAFESRILLRDASDIEQSKLCRQLASEADIIFDVRYRQGFTVEEIVKYDRGGTWTAESVELTLLFIKLVRHAWGVGVIRLSPDP